MFTDIYIYRVASGTLICEIIYTGGDLGRERGGQSPKSFGGGMEVPISPQYFMNAVLIYHTALLLFVIGHTCQ
jgi:hypothetical protein